MKEEKLYKFRVIRERVCEYNIENRESITLPVKAAKIAIRDFYLLQEVQEVCLVFALDSINKIIGVLELNRGSNYQAIIDIQQLFRFLILAGAGRFIMIHNHPSGDCTFSPEDEKIYRKIKQAGEIMDIECLDFLVVAEKENGGKYFNSIINCVPTPVIV